MRLLALDRAAEAESLLAQGTPDTENLLLRALANRELQRWADAEIVARQLLQVSPQDMLALEILGDALHQQRKYDAAIETYRAMLESFSSDAVAAASVHVQLAKVYMDTGDRRSAWQQFELAERLDPRQVAHVRAYQRSIIQSGCQLR